MFYLKVSDLYLICLWLKVWSVNFHILQFLRLIAVFFFFSFSFLFYVYHNQYSKTLLNQSFHNVTSYDFVRKNDNDKSGNFLVIVSVFFLTSLACFHNLPSLGLIVVLFSCLHNYIIIWVCSGLAHM